MKNNRLLKIGAAILCIIIIIMFAFAVGKRLKIKRTQEEEISSLKQSITQIEEQNSKIQETIDNGEDESYIESVARDDYNYVKPEERVYYDSDN